MTDATRTNPGTPIAESEALETPINTGFGTKGYRAYVLGALLLVYIFQLH